MLVFLQGSFDHMMTCLDFHCTVVEFSLIHCLAVENIAFGNKAIRYCTPSLPALRPKAQIIRPKSVPLWWG